MAEDFVDSSKAYLGRGFGFPVTFSKGNKGVVMFEAEKDVQSSLEILMSTVIGERIMQPKFGASLHNYVFDSMDTTFRTFISEQVRYAILLNEPRVRLDNVEYEDKPLEGKVEIKIIYTVLSTNTRSNIVFPFYINEGTDLEQS